MRTLIIIPTAAEVTAECLLSVNAQTDANRSLLISSLRPVPLHAEPSKNKSLNILRNRNQIRPVALASDAEWFLWVDSDVALPKDALSKLLATKKELVGGWYQKKLGSEDWVAAKWKEKKLLEYYQKPQPGLLPVDLLGLGCVLMHRKVLESVPFRGATEEYLTDKSGIRYYAGQCLAFCADAKKKDYQAYLSGEVVCTHHNQRVLYS